MTREEVLQSISLKKRFCKDNNLSIAVYDNPYFYQRLEIINHVTPCVDKFELFCKELEKFKCEQDYFEYYNSVKDNVINHLKNNSSFVNFNTRAIDMPRPHVSKKNLYIEDNDGKKFISLDMKKANFSALHFYDSNIFDGATTWEEFISKFTDSEHIIGSKYIRQVIMGACNPKRQIQQEKLIMFMLLNFVDTQLKLRQPHDGSDIKALLSNIEEYEIYSLGEDEIIIEVTGEKTLAYYTKVIEDIVSDTEYRDFIRVTAFTLKKIQGTDGWAKYITRYVDTNDKENSTLYYETEFKCLNAEIYHQIVKHWIQQPITEDDLVFYHNGCLAKFLEPTINPWK